MENFILDFYETEEFTKELNVETVRFLEIRKRWYKDRAKNDNGKEELDTYFSNSKNVIPGTPLIKDREQNIRFIYEVKKDSYKGYDIYLIIFRKCFERDDEKKYKVFLKKAKDWYDSHPLNEQDNFIIEKMMSKIKEEIVRQESLLNVPNDLHFYTIPDVLTYKYSSHIYESEDWVNKIEHVENKDLEILYDLLYASVDKKRHPEFMEMVKIKNEGEQEDKSIEIYQDWMENVHILYGVNANNQNIYYLLDFKNTRFEKSDLEEIENYINEGKFERFFKRAYPDYILADRHLWKEIERSVDTNLSFSPEEITVLSELNYPLFINGQAGSGKSTILYHLFANIIYQKIKMNNPLGILFITYNKGLLDAARKVVKKILRVNPDFSIDGKIIEDIEGYFQSYIDFLKSYLGAGEIPQFNPMQHITFRKFYNMYRRECQLPESRDISPEAAWYVIRSYIKGYTPDSYLQPDDYMNLFHREQNLDSETYKKIWNIFNSWYINKMNEGYWDDMDLVRYVYNNKLTHIRRMYKNKLEELLNAEIYDDEDIPRMFAVIFSDEAQDFTRVDLLLLLNLLLFSQCSLKNVNVIPVAFAGDPLQTINPTGFNWKRTKRLFTNVHKETGYRGIGLQTRTLKHNYRSLKEIVKFANIIQAYRRFFFDDDSIEPQESWWIRETGHIPEIINIERFKSPSEFKEFVKDNIVILPVELSDEVKTLIKSNKDNYLSIFYNREKDELAGNILGVYDVKGLEFKTVILYGFGEYSDVNISQLFESDGLKEEDRIKIAYFLNKLYVAVTRAKRELIIIDTEKGIEKLWKHFFGDNVDQIFSEKIPAKLKTLFQQHWKDNIGKARVVDSAKLESSEKPEVLAEKFEKKGMNEEDPDTLRRAAYYYGLCQKREKEYLCRGYAEEFEGKFNEAGYYFNLAPDFKKAIENYWKDCSWGKVLKIAKDKGITNFYTFSSEFLLKKETLKKERVFQLINEILSHNGWSPHFEAYSVVLNGVLDFIIGLSDKDINDNRMEFTRWAERFSKVGEMGFPFIWKSLGMFNYRLKNYEWAKRNFDRVPENEKNFREYYLFMANYVQDINQKIKYYNQAGDLDSIIRLWRGSKDFKFEPQSVRIVINALKSKDFLEEAYLLALEYIEFDMALKILEKLLRKEGSKARYYFKNFANVLSSSFQLDVALKFADKFLLKEDMFGDIHQFFLSVLHDNILTGKEIYTLTNFVYEKRKRIPEKFKFSLVEFLARPETRTKINNLYRNVAGEESEDPRKEREAIANIFEKFLEKEIWRRHKESVKENKYFHISVLGTAMENADIKLVAVYNFYEEMWNYCYNVGDIEGEMWAKTRWLMLRYRSLHRKLEKLQRESPLSKEIDNIRKEIDDLALKSEEWGVVEDYKVFKDPEPLSAYVIVKTSEGYIQPQVREGISEFRWKDYIFRESSQGHILHISDSKLMFVVKIPLSNPLKVEGLGVSIERKEIDQEDNILVSELDLRIRPIESGLMIYKDNDWIEVKLR